MKKMRERLEEYDDFLLGTPKEKDEEGEGERDLSASVKKETGGEKGGEKRKGRKGKGKEQKGKEDKGKGEKGGERGGEKGGEKGGERGGERGGGEKGGPNRDPILNFAKIFLIGEQILNFDEISENNSLLNLENSDNDTDYVIRNFLEHLPTYDHEVLWKFSHQCEPSKRERKEKEKKEAK
jgi:hypothetical protein